MFGTLRYVLANLVVFGHLWPFIGGRSNTAGHYAILTFFVLSGYLMTLVLRRRYGFSRAGLRRYAANRVLRIFPPYWLAIAVSALLLVRWPEASASVASPLGLPGSLGDWMQNIFILGLHLPRETWLIPPAWSLSVELVFYAAMAAALSRSRVTVLAWVGATVAYIGLGWALGVAAGVVLEGPDWLPSKTACLAFALGALAYEVRARALPAWAAVASAVVYAVNLAVGPAAWPGAGVAGAYCCIACSFVIVCYLSRIRPRDVTAVLARIDRGLGDIAYPIFLVHYQAAVLIVHFVFADAKPWSSAPFWYALPLVHVLAIALHLTVESPLAVLRDRIRPATIS